MDRKLLRPLILTVGILTGVFPARAASDYATPYVFTMFAGVSSIGSTDGLGSEARFYSPQAITTDAAGFAYIVDEGNHTIRRVSLAGVVTTLAGSPGEPGSADGPGTAARFDSPQGIVADSANNLYVTDTGNHTIRKISPAGVVTTLAGLAGVTGDVNGGGSVARFDRPRGIAVDKSDNLYVTEAGNRLVRKITPQGVVSTFASGSFPEARDIGARHKNSYGAIAVDAQGNVYASSYAFNSFYDPGSYVGDYYYLYVGFVIKITPDGTTQNLWQTSVYQYLDGRVSGYGTSGLAFNPAGILLIASGSQIIRYSPADNSFVKLTGVGLAGSTDGPPDSARLGAFFDLAVDRNGNIWVADTGNNNIRRVDAIGTVSTVAGLALERAATTSDGSGAAARFTNPVGTAVDGAGNVYVADSSTHCIRKITPAGVVTTLAGTPGIAGTADGTGPAARFSNPTGIAVDAAGILYVTDNGSHLVRRITPTGETTTLAGMVGNAGTADGQGATAQFLFPKGIAVDQSGNLYVASAATIRKISPSGETTTLAGFANEVGYVDAVGSSARFVAPYGVAVDANNNVYVSEAPDSPAIARIRKITPNGTVTTFAGGDHGYGDGSASVARFHNPYGLAVDTTGNVFVADSYNQVIRKITPQGAVSTIAGLADSPGGVDGTGRAARFFYPQGIAFNAAGKLYVTSGTTISAGVPAVLSLISVQPQSLTVLAGSGATFSVTASGTPAPTYQWQRNGVNLTGAISSTLSLSSVQPSDAGDYNVVVTNSLGSITSAKATLTVTAPPAQPPPAQGGGGGGGPSGWFLAALGGLRLLRRFRPRTTSRL